MQLRRLYEFDGVVTKLGGGTDRLEASNLLLRGSVLKNTDWVLGLVLFAGLDTKMFRNRAAAPRKESLALQLLPSVDPQPRHWRQCWSRN